MNKQIKWMIGIVAFLLLIILAGAGYRYLSSGYKDSGFPEKVSDSRETMQKAVDMTLLDQTKNEVKLSEKFGKPIVVNFWATWCGPCRSEMPVFEKLYQEYKDEIHFMMVNLTHGHDTIEKVETFIKNQGYSFPVYYDRTNAAGNAYGVTSIPATLFINKKGEVAMGILGAMNENFLRGQIENLLKK